MISKLRNCVTPMVTTFFVVSLVPGLTLFFHVGGRAWHGTREWLSIVLILPFVLHPWRNGWPTLNYFERMRSAAICLGRKDFRQQCDPPVPVLGVPTDEIVTRLESFGFDMSSP